MTDLRRRSPLNPAPLRRGVDCFCRGLSADNTPTTASAPAPTRSAGPPPAAANAITSAAALIRAMHDRYGAAWFHTLTFTQKTTVPLPSGGEIVQT